MLIYCKRLQEVILEFAFGTCCGLVSGGVTPQTAPWIPACAGMTVWVCL